MEKNKKVKFLTNALCFFVIIVLMVGGAIGVFATTSDIVVGQTYVFDSSPPTVTNTLEFTCQFVSNGRTYYGIRIIPTNNSSGWQGNISYITALGTGTIPVNQYEIVYKYSMMGASGGWLNIAYQKIEFVTLTNSYNGQIWLKNSLTIVNESDGYELGYLDGYNKGYNEGLDVGYDNGFADGEEVGGGNFFGMLFDPVGALMSVTLIEIDGVAFTIGTFFFTIVGILIFVAFLRYFAGG